MDARTPNTPDTTAVGVMGLDVPPERHSMIMARMARRTAGRVGWGGGPGIVFFPLCCCETAVLQEGVGNHRHECMAVKSLPTSTLEVVEADLLFELLMRLLADPARLDGRCQCAQIGLRWKVGEIVFLFAASEALVNLGVTQPHSDGRRWILVCRVKAH